MLRPYNDQWRLGDHDGAGHFWRCARRCWQCAERTGLLQDPGASFLDEAAAVAWEFGVWAFGADDAGGA
jgi:hypothetical protein